MLHKAQPDTAKLDRLAAVVLRSALVWESARMERLAARTDSYSNAGVEPKAAAEDLQKAVAVYRQALVDEVVPEPTDAASTITVEVPEPLQPGGF